MKLVWIGFAALALAGCSQGPYDPPGAVVETVAGPKGLTAKLTYNPGARMELHVNEEPLALVMEYPSGKPTVEFVEVDEKTVKLLIKAAPGTNARVPEREKTVDGIKLIVEGP